MESLEKQHIQFANRKFLATPISVIIAWLLVAISGLLFPDEITVRVLFIATGSIVYLALLISKLTSENFLDKSIPKNVFDGLLLFTVAQAVLVYAIAIPFFLADYTSLPLTVGVLTGTMWLPFSWIIKHWIGIFHALLKTALILLFWYLLPEQRYIAILFTIVVVYIITIVILNKRTQSIIL